MSFSENLKKLRSEKNLSQEQLAELLGVSRQAVSKWEQDGGYPETEKLIQLADKLDVSLDALLLNRQTGAETKEPIQKNQAAISTDKKIAVHSYDGKTLNAYSKFTIMTIGLLWGKKGKNYPRYLLTGDNGGFWDNRASLGWYKTIEDAQKELNEIYTAIENGEAAYHLKYNVKVKFGAFSMKIIDNDE